MNISTEKNVYIIYYTTVDRIFSSFQTSVRFICKHKVTTN